MLLRSQFKSSTQESDFHGRSSPNFGSAPYYDVIGEADAVSFSSHATEDRDDDAGDFHIGTGGNPQEQATNGDDE